MQRRVAITGIGAVSGLGVGIAPFWEGLCAGRSALRPVTQFDPSGLSCHVAAEVPAFAGAKDFVPKGYRKAVKVMARDTELAVAAAKLAVEDARLVTRGTLPEDSAAPTTYPSARLGCNIGAGLIAAEADELTSALVTASTAPAPGAPAAVDLRAWGTAAGGSGAMNNLPPLWMLKYLPNMLACHVTIIHGCEGPSNTITAVEASGLLSIGESCRVIQRDSADVCFSGGAESPVNIFRFFRFELFKRLAATGSLDLGAPGASERILRPYDPASAGGLLGEGGGLLVLEAHDTARARGATILAEITGFGAAQSGPSDPNCWTTGGLDVEVDEGLQYAIENALDDAKLNPSEIDAIVPHASGVPAIDRCELGALRAVFTSRLKDIPLITITPAVGDCLAGHGALAMAAAALAIRHQTLPARLHAGGCPANVQAGPAPTRPLSLRHILVCTGSLGGQNAAAVVSRA